jgi:Flp pilus assembly protein TadB
MNVDTALWIGVASLVLAIPLGIASNLLTSRLISYLEKRKLIKANKTRQQAIQIYHRIRAFRGGKRDKYPYYILLAISAVLFAIAGSTIVIVVLLISPSFETAVVSFGLACVMALMSVGFVTARQLERFDDYKKEFEERWGPLDEND